MDSNLATLENNTKQLEDRFDKLREEIISQLREFSDCIKSAKTLCHEATQMTIILENKLTNASNEEKEWKDIKLKLATTSIKGKVILDVGGERYSTSVDTLTREKDTFFTALFSKQWEVERDPDDKSIFIDRNGKIFVYILEYFRTNKLPNDIMTNESLRQLLITEAEYFRLHNLIYVLTEPERKQQEMEEMEERKKEELRSRMEKAFPDGTLLQSEQKVKLCEFYGKTNQQWQLIYKARRDGFDANAFHTRCNNQGPTMTIIQSNNNYLFGGYTTIPWTSDTSYKHDTTAFLFTLTNPHHIPPTKYLINSTLTRYATHHYSGHGVTFGGGHDMHLVNSSNSNNNSYSNFPHSYIDTTGKGNATFTGARDFTTSDIEVFKLS